MIVYAPREITVDKFYGDGAVGETTRFLCRIERAWECLHIDSDKEKISYLYEKVGEEVEREIRCHLEGRAATADQVLEIIKRCYGEKRTLPALKRAFLNTKQRKDEGVRAFSHRLKEAFDAVTSRQRDTEIEPSPTSELRDTFVENLRDKQTRRHLRGQLTSSPNATFNEIRLQAQKMEDDNSDFEGEEEESFDLRQVAASRPTDEVTLKLLTEQVAKLTTLLQEKQTSQSVTEQQSSHDRASRAPHVPRPNQNTQAPAGRGQRRIRAACYQCGQYGHFSRDCKPRPPRAPSQPEHTSTSSRIRAACYRCGQYGHFSRDCRAMSGNE